MKEIEVLDLQTWAYKTGDDRVVTVSMMEKNQKKTPQSSGNVVAVTIDVDGKTVLTSDDHVSTLEQFGLGEYLIHSITHCISSHMAEWTRWQAFADRVLVPALHEESRPAEVELPSELQQIMGVSVHRSPLAARHIEQLTDEQSAWWLCDLDDPNEPELTANLNPNAVSVTLGKIGEAAWKQLEEENQEFFSNWNPTHH